jgi:hypothetical protein
MLGSVLKNKMMLLMSDLRVVIMAWWLPNSTVMNMELHVFPQNSKLERNISIPGKITLSLTRISHAPPTPPPLKNIIKNLSRIGTSLVWVARGIGGDAV